MLPTFLVNWGRHVALDDLGAVLVGGCSGGGLPAPRMRPAPRVAPCTWWPPPARACGSVIPSFDSSAEFSGRDIRDLVAKIKATRVKAVFSETSLPPRTAETIAREAGVKVVEGEGALYGDSLGPAGSDGDTYLKMIRHNTATIVSNLSGA